MKKDIVCTSQAEVESNQPEPSSFPARVSISPPIRQNVTGSCWAIPVQHSVKYVGGTLGFAEGGGKIAGKLIQEV